jgi:hypothetical protein
MKYIAIVLIMLGVGAGVFFAYTRSGQEDTPPVTQNRESTTQTAPRNLPTETVPQQPQEIFTFSVTVPENTPPTDTIYINTHRQIAYPMKQIAPRTHEITFSRSELGPESDGYGIGYRYSRNNANFITAEYLEPDTNDYFWTHLGRNTEYSPEGVQNDTVNRWRWLPQGNQAWSTSTARAAEGIFLPRVGNKKFRSGQVIQDLYMPGFDEHFETTGKHLKATGHTWVTLAPPWDCIGEGSNEGHPNYPTEQKFIGHVRAFKNAGLKVAVGPQVGCTEEEAQKDEAYWENYFIEQERFLVSQARLAERAGADAFYFSGFESQEAPFEIGERWRNIWVEIIKVFSGEIGEHTWYFNQGGSPSVIPALDYYRPWADLLDFFIFQTTAPLSTSSVVTDEELVAQARARLKGTEELYREFNKPVMVMTAYASVKDSWRGADFYEIEMMNIPWNGESEWQQGKYEFNGKDQARVMQAYWSAIRDLPWITGFANFGYWHWAMPLAPDMSVREKPAETVFQRWNQKTAQ